MSTILEIDKHLRVSISLFFRVILVVYSIVLLTLYDEVFRWYYNLVVIVIYIIMYFILNKRNKFISILRLLNDYIFITYVLFQTKELDVYSFSLLFAPILNTHNHSGEKKSFLLYIIPLLSIFIIKNEINILYIIPFVLFLSINSFDSIRARFFRFQQKLNSVIDDFFISEELINKPYKIYRKAIPIINKSNTLVHNISNIFCLKIEDNRISIVNGSTFIWNYEIIDKKFFLETVKEKNIIYNVKMNLNNHEMLNNIVVVCKVNSHPYCFILTSENFEKFNHFPYTLFISKLLTPFFYRLSKVLDADLRQKKNVSIKLTELEEKVNYVSNCVNAMHFIKNKLGPVKSYLAMSEDLNRKSDPEIKQKIELYLVKERQKLKISMNQILERADYILTKSNNPFNVYNTKCHGIQMLFSEIRRIWNYYFNTDNFYLNLVISKDRVKYDVKYNQVGIELVLTNWISNMSKYNTGIYGVIFGEDEEYYNVTFYNNFDCSLPNSSKFVDDFNTSDRAEITRRNTRGLLEIKDFLAQMDILVDMVIINEQVHFKLGFKKYLYNESTNNRK